MAFFDTSNMFSAPPFWRNGPSPGGVFNFPGPSAVPEYPTENNTGSQRSQVPITTGTSVLAVKCEGGVVIAADILGSYGSLARFRSLSRVMKVNENIVLGCGGDYADFQCLRSIVEQKVIDEQCLDDGFALKPRSLLCWLTRVLYNRRSKLDPFWTTFIVGGVQDGEPFLGTVDKLGTAFEDDHIATGYGAYIALPLMRDAVMKKGTLLNKKEAQKLLQHCLQVLYYRDARSFPKYEMITLTDKGVNLEGPLDVKANWDIANLIRGYE